MLASGTDTQHEDELARRRKGFRPLADLDEGRGIDPYREAETAEPISWLPRRGTEHRATQAPTVAPLVLDIDVAALRLAGQVRAQGGTWGPDQYAWLAGRYPQGVPEDALIGIVTDMVGAASAATEQPQPQAAGLRLVK
jgi:hypothetical protein